jgi:hypothetical protein
MSSIEHAHIALSISDQENVFSHHSPASALSSAEFGQ